ncbi:hypothetical protein Pint_14583 [Pistacia integerrima]|uniref:Uncharacterized protein n=1 Tax=Pistacia integerrima TaxID=434235 RepID=A0ACC0YBQ1_9ROSI|nr:hypothetical protein Pint_14583 [Pistacia integerrima]
MPSRTIRTTAITKDDQQNHPKYDLKDDNEDEDKDDKNSRTSLDTLWIRGNGQFISHCLHPTAAEIRIESRAFISTSTTNQVSRMLRDMSIAVLQELRGFSLNNDNINPDGENNAQQNKPNGHNDEERPRK